ncbi:hypothetical protein KJ819_02820 [Patescibacteria group bacterium]|nr:hypothetical protein [Patescibacteria group bacterium]MBU1500791.1 hypothetical protein [Patescibacteria group bacterium]MBU2080846.1 hypothetical protein [Patescibacteria group bacterium]MBU2123951.1 hypothetical protein [Patescibacteria group bacterium]MBU2194758.1 hypothetical protein [Patescibacteria group bacterium]
MEGSFAPRQESAQQAEVRELVAAIHRTLTDEEMATFNSIGDPAISEDERQDRIRAFNSLNAGKADSEETLAERVYTNVPINFSGKELKVSRDMRGRISIAELS